jgi:hypothetical protein
MRAISTNCIAFWTISLNCVAHGLFTHKELAMASPIKNAKDFKAMQQF